MSEWDEKYDLEELSPEFLAIRSLFLTGHIKKMSQLEKQSPTKIASLLKLQYNSYHEKLQNPELFSEFHINLLAYACKINPLIIHDIIQAETKSKVKQAYVNYNKKVKSKGKI
ncbi:hypothetical protein PBAC_19300 [Pedobacter glucosidilyticus]|nr:hypothetical protein [Pedobacter glucosidilyticus]KHJ37918.1 hypothetical protein PBAC_19300 [Pedobacter glucosidilyticus]